jgi:hypothetical protein
MPITNGAYSKYIEHKGQAGYGAAILVKQQNEPFYSLLVASETVPSIYGSQESFEFDLLNSPVKGKIQGKMSLDDKEVEVLHHRDNVYRFEKLKNKVLDFMIVDNNFVGYKFSGTLSYRMNDATADVLRGTYTITPMSADPNPVYDARSLCQETLCFADVVPDTVKVGDKITLSVVQASANPTFSVKTLSNDGKETDVASAVSSNVFTAPSNAGLYVITASATGYADWSTTVYVESQTTT